MFPFPIIPPMGLSLITADAADFDGTNDYATRGAGLTGVVDSKLFTLVVWRYSDGGATVKTILASSESVGGAAERFAVRTGATRLITISASSSAPAVILDVETTTSVPNNQWDCLMISVDMADTNKRHIYQGDAVKTGGWFTYTDAAIDFTNSDWSFAADPDGSTKHDGGFAEVMFWPGVYIDFSQTANRRKFISSSGKPINPSAGGGAIATLGAPAIYFHLDDGETANNFVANNDGGATGGAFTVTGALTTYGSSPSD